MKKGFQWGMKLDFGPEVACDRMHYMNIATHKCMHYLSMKENWS
jgi:hypothetical protein